jgi:hypothetical protein
MQLLVSPLDAADVVVLGDRAVPRQVEVELMLDPSGVMYRLALAITDGRPECRELRVVAQDGDRGIRQGDLAAIKVDDFTAAAFATVSRREDESLLDRVTGLSTITKTIAESGGPKYRTVSPKHLERVAQTYRADVTGAPTRAVAEAFGVPHSTAARWVLRARKAGQLPPTTKGRKQA